MHRERIQQVKGASRRQVLRTVPVPEKLGDLIRLVNLLPTGTEPPPDILTFYMDTGSSEAQDWLKEYKRAIAQLPDGIQAFIGPINWKTISSAYSRYSLLLDARDIFRQIASGQINQGVALPGTQVLAKLDTDKEGRITIKPTPLADALAGVEATRIRECPVCGNIYWAGRKDKPCCSASCNTRRRVRQWRKRYPEKYKQQRVQKEGTKANNRRK